MNKTNGEARVKRARTILRRTVLMAIPVTVPPALFAVRDMLGCRYEERHVLAYGSVILCDTAPPPPPPHPHPHTRVSPTTLAINKGNAWNPVACIHTIGTNCMRTLTHTRRPACP
jgi:hypothetical protein